VDGGDVFGSLLPGILLNLLLAIPVFAACRRLFRVIEPLPEVRLIV
jgi:hypothetical protein